MGGGGRSNGQSAARTAQAAIPARTNHTINEPQRGPQAAAGKSPGSVIAKRSLGLVKMEEAQQIHDLSLPIGAFQSEIRDFPAWGRPPGAADRITRAACPRPPAESPRS